MDVIKALQELHQEKKRLDAAITALETRLRLAKGARADARVERRGRKSMSPEERQEVSRRMAKYWEERRAQSNQESPEVLSEPTPTDETS
jgi:hypothetical protein